MNRSRTGAVCAAVAVLGCMLGAAVAEERAIAGAVRADGTWINQDDVEEIGDYYALIIAIDKYGTREWRLRTPVADGKAVAKLLREHYGFKDVIELYDEKATFFAIRSAIAKLGRKVGPRDSVLIYYAGHGILEKDTGFWVPADGKPREEWTYLRHIVIRDMIKIQAFGARHVLIVSDSCYAAGMFRSARLPEKVAPEYVRRALRRPARQLLTSGGLAPVADGGGGGHSVFATYFLKCLRQPPRDVFVPSDIMPDLKYNVGQNAPKIQGERQVPILGVLDQAGAERDGEFVFIRRTGRRADTPTQPADAAEVEALIDAARQRQENLKKAKELFEKLAGFERGGAPLTREDARTRAELWRKYLNTFGDVEYRIEDARRYLAAHRDWRPATTQPETAQPHTGKHGKGGLHLPEQLPQGRMVFQHSEDRRYVVYDSGTILDTRTGLEWLVSLDKGRDYDSALRWVKGCKIDGGGWRMPTQKELATLYEKDKGNNIDPVVAETELQVWSSELEGDRMVKAFSFRRGSARATARSYDREMMRAFAVREGEKKGEKAPDRIGARHILIAHQRDEGSSVKRTKDEALTLAAEVLKKARADGADFAALAKAYSDCPSGKKGGDLGRFGKGMMVEPFEKAAWALKVGEISGIIETSYGFHIIKRTE